MSNYDSRYTYNFTYEVLKTSSIQRHHKHLSRTFCCIFFPLFFLLLLRNIFNSCILSKWKDNWTQLLYFFDQTLLGVYLTFTFFNTRNQINQSINLFSHLLHSSKDWDYPTSDGQNLSCFSTMSFYPDFIQILYR